MNIGLVLTGGGARAAYQVGVLRALAEIIGGNTESPFKVMAGVSAGAINTAYIMTHADQFPQATRNLWDLWLGLSPEQIYRTDPSSLTKIGSKWLKDLSFGGAIDKGKSNFLLDTSPLFELLKREVPINRLPQLLESGLLRGAALSVTNYLTGTAITFFDGAKDIQPWVRSTRLGVRATLTHEHVMASSAIPVFFPPVSINQTFYGDGCIRLSAPLSPAIHLGAEKIITIGIRYLRSTEQTIEENKTLTRESISMADISGVLLNAVFLDSLETDLERMERINKTLTFLTEEQRSKLPQPLRPIPVLALRPSRDLGKLASGQFDHFPKMLRFLLRGIGAVGEKGWDLLSYLAFDSSYTRQLLELGYSDTLLRKEEIERFLSS